METERNTIVRRAAASHRNVASRPSRRVRQAFTLIELLLVLVILAVLAGLVVPQFTNRSKQARETAAKTDVSAMQTAIDAYEVDTGTFPSKLDDLIVAPGGITNWNGPYLKRQSLPKDPWGNEYVYKYPGQVNASSYDLYSFGLDGREGNDDIGNITR